MVGAISGKASLYGLKASNPKPFKTPSAFQSPEISLTLDIWTLGDDTVVINEVVISGSEITYEVMVNGRRNIDAIKRNVDSYFIASRPGFHEKKEAEPWNKKQKKLIIEKLIVRDGKINVSASFLDGKSMSVNLPGLTLKNIGMDKGGASVGGAANKIITSFWQNINKTVEKLDLG